MQLKNIPYITLWVNKFEETISFYKNILELPVESEDENFIQFNTAGTKLFIHRSMSGIEEPLRKDVLEIHFDVNDVDKVYKELESRGVEFESVPKNMPWGTRVVAFKDPEGFTVELVGPHKKGEAIAKH